MRKLFRGRRHINLIIEIENFCPLSLWRVRVQVELGPNNNYSLFSSDLCDVRSKTESFYKVY